MNWGDFAIGVIVCFCLLIGLPWAIALIYEAYERIKEKRKGGEMVEIKRIKETSSYGVYDEKGNLLKSGFKDLHDAHEFATNYLLKNPERNTVCIKAEITITVKRK